MSCDKNDIIMFVEEHFDNKIDKDTFTFVKELYEYVSFLYDGDYSETDELTSESDDESTVKETLKIKKDKEGFYSLD
tara:strand:+ start:148 stop:378 length:231 start_codon:yes stop_codon:yes gene_type:complete